MSCDREQGISVISGKTTVMDFVQPIIVFFAYVVIYSYNNHKGSDIPFPKRVYVPCPDRKCMLKRFPELGGVTFISFYGEEKMKANILRKKPCSKCPYTLGQIRTVTNPCPQCKANGYQSFERFKMDQSGNKRGRA